MVSPSEQVATEVAQLLKQHLPGVNQIHWNRYPDLNLLPEILHGRAPELCLLDVMADRTVALGVLGSIVGLAGQTKVVAILGANDPDLILASLRQGAAEFLLLPLTSDQFSAVITRLAPAGVGLRQKGGAKVYSVVPAKGACGASTLASNLALEWKRQGSGRSLLVDLDPLAGVISFLFKLKSNYSFLDALTRAHSLDADLWRGLVLNYQGVDVLLAPENPLDAAAGLSDPAPIIEFCRSLYEVVTLDVGEPFSRWSQSILRSSDQVLLVATNELPAVRAAGRVLQYFDRSDIDRSRVKLVIDRFSPGTGLAKDEIQKTLESDVVHVLPNDYQTLQKALIDGKPAPATSSFGKSLHALATALSGKSTAKPEKAKAEGTLWSLFGSLISRRA